MLFTRQITLAKAAELLEMARDDFSRVLKLMGLEYSYLSEEEIEREQKMDCNWNSCSATWRGQKKL